MWLQTGTLSWASTLLALVVHSTQWHSTLGRTTTAIDGQPFPALIDATLEDLATGLERGLFTSVDLVAAYTARILETNATLHAVTELNPDAAAVAGALDAERAWGAVRGPLHGVPVLLKNSIATADRMGTTAGSHALEGATVAEDSTVAARLRRAGAVLLGKTNLSEWANFRSANTSNGWSALGGQTYGAYFPGQDPSGSSSGSAVASSLGLALAALGTETDGSILLPADVNNLVGVKPTVGLTSRHLVVPVSEHQDTVGPLARTVRDAAYVLQALVDGGPDPKDNYTLAPRPFDQPPDYVAACDYWALRGARIGVPRNYMDLSGAPRAAVTIPVFDAALDVLRNAGATIVDDIALPGHDVLQQGGSDFTADVVLNADFVSNLPAKYLSQLATNPHGIRSLADLRTFTTRVAPDPEDYPRRDTAVWDAALVLGHGNDDADGFFWGNYTRGLRCAGWPLGITGALRNFSLDALVVPTAFAPHLPALLGSPVVTVPLGAYPPGTPVAANAFGDLNATAPNRPFGIAFMGDRWSDARLIGLAYAFEQRTNVRARVLPYVSPVTELVDVVRRRREEVV